MLTLIKAKIDTLILQVLSDPIYSSSHLLLKKNVNYYLYLFFTLKICFKVLLWETNVCYLIIDCEFDSMDG